MAEEALALRPYQNEALEAINKSAEELRRPLIAIPTGGGKTVVFTHLLAERAQTGRALVLAHRDELLTQAADKIASVMPGVWVGRIKAEENDILAPVIVASVQTLSRENRLAQLPTDITTVVVDEAHHAAAESYRRILKHVGAFQDEGAPLTLGVTATPMRGDKVGLDSVFEKIVYEISILELIGQGYLCDLTAKRVEIQADYKSMRTSRGDFVAGDAARMLMEAGAPSAIAQVWGEVAPSRKGIVFTPTVAVAHACAEALLSVGIVAEAVDGTTPEDERKGILRRLKTGETQVVANCGILVEGFDEPSIDCVAIARPTKSRTLYCLDAQTEVLGPDGWLGCADVSEGTEVAAFDPETSEIRWECATGYVRRPLRAHESMFALSSPGIDIRVSDQHRMLYRTRRGRSRTRSAWGFDTAQALSERRGEYEIPVSGLQDAPGVPLTDDELRFLGWFVSDGCLNRANGAIYISQRSDAPWIDELRKCLHGCGFKYGELVRNDDTNFGPRSAPLLVFSISKGQPRGRDRHLRGWGALEGYVSKDLAPALENMTSEQFGVFLEALHLGDGSKQRGQSWTRRSYHIGTANRTLADRLQSLGIRRGWKANVVEDRPGFYFVRLKQTRTRYVGGRSAKDRPTLRPSPFARGETVWCVSVPSGAIVVRRNGKAAIVGNCQMVGRGTRKFPGKSDCLILDLVGSTLRHDLMTLNTLFGLPLDKLDNGKRVTEAVQELQDEGEEVAVDGRVVTIDVDLLKGRDSTWIGAGRGTYAISLGNDRMYLVEPSAGEDGKARIYLVDGKDSSLLAEYPDFEMALGIAEERARTQGAGALVDSGARWRLAKASDKQLQFLDRLRIPREPNMTKGRASDLIQAYKAQRAVRRLA